LISPLDILNFWADHPRFYWSLVAVILIVNAVLWIGFGRRR
jgi:hypothetical protein